MAAAPTPRFWWTRQRRSRNCPRSMTTARSRRSPSRARPIRTPLTNRLTRRAVAGPELGSMRQVFGACANIFAPDDGRVVTADHGCGAHSEVLVDTTAPVEELPTVYDDSEVEAVAVSRSADSDTADEPADS